VVLTDEGLEKAERLLQDCLATNPRGGAKQREPSLQIVVAMSAPQNANKIAKQRISEETIRALASAESFARGRTYADDGAVSELVRRSDRLTAEVEGSEFDPYQVSIRLQGDGVADAHCTCAYDWGGYCKHIVAVLLKFSDEITPVIERRPIAEVLAGLDQARLIELLEKRSESDPELVTWIEAELATAIPDRKDPGRRRTPVDPAPILELARVLLAARNRRGRYWEGYRSSGDIEELQRLVEKAVPFLEEGDGGNALRILEPIGEAFVNDWLDHSSGSDEHLYELFADLGSLMAEAALMSEFAADERDALAETLEEWQDRLEEHGIDEGFHVAIRALQTGWDDPVLAAVMAGKGRSWPPSGGGDWLEDQLTAVRLRVLEACGRTEEYLNLARAAQARTSYVCMLVKLERTSEAITYALKSFKKPDEALVLAKALREAAAHDGALRIAETGLGLVRDDEDEMAGSSTVPLACWLRDYAGGIGRTAMALKAARVAFEHSLSLENFRAVQMWAGAEWDTIRKDLLKHLAGAPHAYDRIRIYLSEGLIDEAVRAVGDRFGHAAHDETLMNLASAAHASHPEWVIRLAMHQANSIMDANRAGHYALAAQWLETAALAYEVLGGEDAWRACLDELIERHRRKYKLRPLLEGLRGR
jgi:uncharacterized Zn finger protein